MVQDLVTFFNLNEFDFQYIDAVDDIVLYPNPNNGFFAIHNNSSEDIIAGKITIINSSGQVISSQNNINIYKQQPHYLNLSGIQAGAYIIVIESNKKIAQKKMILSPGI